MGTERTSDHCSHCFRQFQTNIGMKTERKLERLGPFSKLADTSHSLLDSVRMKLRPDEFHESKQPDNSVSRKENLELIVSESVPTYKHIEPEYRPQAILNYKRYIESSREKGNEKLPNVDIELMKLNVQKHLLYMGWRFAERRRKLRFASPGGEIFHSLYTACEAYLEKEENMGKTYGSSLKVINVSQNSWCASIGNKINDSKEISLLCQNHCFSTSMDPDEFQKSDEVSNNGTENRSILVFSSPDCGEGFGNSCLEKLKKSKTGIKISSLLPLKVVGCRRLLEHYCSQKSKKRKVQDLRSKGYEAGSIFLQPEHQLSERCQFVPVTSPAQKVVEAPWSMLIENRIVLARQKVHYISKRDGHVLMEGHITRNGIKCRCCRKLHSLTGFEAHAGSDKCKPGANTFLLDGRSLLQCHLQMVYGKDLINFPHPRLKHVYAHSQSDSVCSVCQYGGTLMLCDHCPSAFHVECVGLKLTSVKEFCCRKTGLKCACLTSWQDLPKGKWFCPSCRCGICASSAFSSAEQFTAKTMLYCDQCERKLRSVQRSELNRLNFWGFYTMLLVRGDEIISVATFRVYGAKIAEMPLVGTRAKYRRQGMCHIILDELEKENSTNTKIVPVKILIDLEVYGLVSKGIEVVELLDSLPSLDIQSCYLPGQNDTPEKISYQNLHSHSPALSGCTDPFAKSSVTVLTTWMTVLISSILMGVGEETCIAIHFGY
ncbi:PHD-finger [Musa troglodytarum]|uniref:PHD-finger n=1 Tax=Musa troglodytarum TaxID=320322 RepID=A0A9E7JEB9_9LILI|nr:PHD-finger [Musa troglodytarum]